MKAYLIRRLLLIIPTFIGISLVTFMVMQLLPGNPIFLRLQAAQGAMASGGITEEVIEQTKKIYGLDKPKHIQFLNWLGRMAILDFGTSMKDSRPVTDKLLEALPVTLQLNAISLFLIYVISVPIGVYSATHQRTRSDAVITLILFILYSLPNFWVAMLLIYFLGGVLEWFPVAWLSSSGADSLPWHLWLWDRMLHLVLPVTCLTYSGLAVLSRYARAGMVEVIRQDYIRTARAYGFSEKVVVFKYAMRNSLIPVITLFGTLLPTLIAGSVIVETIFSLPGLGKMIYDAILSRDYPVVMGILTMTAFLTMFGLILSDILYAIVDPRIRFE